MKKIKIFLVYYIIILFDYLTKKWINENIELNQNKHIISILNISNVHNYGIVFGTLSQQKKYLFALNFIICAIYILYLNKKNTIKIYDLLIISGAIGNLIDRIHYGYITDFIDFKIYKFHFPNFNISDISIFFGMLCILFEKNIKK
ncbi:Lipoprotein signal peptidase [Buchnera aphidicola (Tetraneura ulmi)]|uniref:signal peptidase II n=1 Tax=Buchnera aphidicola TaxID=9 RepID=UPI003463B237